MNDLLSQSVRLPDGRRLMFAEYGAPEARPVFYFHGLAGSRLEPGMLGGALFTRANIRLIAIDRPGMGGSDFQVGRGFSHWPADVAFLAGELGWNKFGVWGVSGGGGYVAACARMIPERLSAAVIVSGAGPMNSPEARESLPAVNRWMWGLAGRSPRWMELFLGLSKAVQSNPDKIRQQMLHRMPPAEKAWFQSPGRLEAFIASGLESMRQGVRGAAWDTHLYAVEWDFRLEEVRFPVRLLHGEDDRNVPAAVARQVAAAMTSCQATFYPGEGHISMLVNRLTVVLDWLNSQAV